MSSVGTKPAGKTCTKCRKTKQTSEFYIKNKKTGELRSCCKSCHNGECLIRYRADPQHHNKRAKAWARANPEKVREIQRHHRERHHDRILARERLQDRRRAIEPERRAKKREYDRVYKQRHAEVIAAARATFYRQNRDRLAEYHRRRYEAKRGELLAGSSRWKKENQVAVLAMTHRRQARLKAGGSWTATEWEAIKVAQDYTCLLCGRREPEIRLTVDHVVPLSKGGPNVASNLQGLCKSCNCRKHRKVLDLRKK